MKQLTAMVTPLVVVVFLAACTQGDKTVILRYKFVPGQKLTYEQLSKKEARVIESDSIIKEHSMVFEMQVEQMVNRLLDDSTAEISEVAQWSYEKRSEEDSTVVDTIKEKRELILQVQPNGKVRDVKLSAGEDPTRIRYIRNYYEQGMPVFPVQEVAPGYSWTQTTKVILPEETMEATMTYTVTSLVREAGYDCAVIECDGTMIIPIEPNPRDSVQISGLDRIKTTGLLYFAYREGMVVLQHERWVIDRNRRKTVSGETSEYKEEVELDIDYMLKGRTVAGNPAL